MLVGASLGSTSPDSGTILGPPRVMHTCTSLHTLTHYMYYIQNDHESQLFVSNRIVSLLQLKVTFLFMSLILGLTSLYFSKCGRKFCECDKALAECTVASGALSTKYSFYRLTNPGKCDA